MFVPFDTLPDTSRVWIYQSEKRFTEAEKNEILEKARHFIDSWQSHGNELKGSTKILHDHFLIISVDASYYSPSGCSIDKSVHFINVLESELRLKLLDRSKQSFLRDDRVQFFPVGHGKQVIQEGIVHVNTKTFNNSVESIAELETKWLVDASDSWLGKFFKKNN